MGTRLMASKAVMSGPRARRSNGREPSTVEPPGHRQTTDTTTFKAGPAPTAREEATTRWPKAVLAAMMSSARQLLFGGPPPPPPSTTFELKREAWLPAQAASGAAARTMVSEAAADVGLDGEQTWDLMLATSEAFANAVQHGEAWPNECILVSTEPCGLGLRVEVTDCGRFDSQLEPAGLDSTSGRGVQIIAAIVDRLEVQNGNGRTRVAFEKHTSRT